MGRTGPIPERKSNLVGHRSKDEIEGKTVTRIRRATKVSQPRADQSWHPIAIRLYDATKISGQAQFYEPSDWAMLYFACDEISSYIEHGRAAMKLAAINQMLTTLLLTEGERRRVSMEIDRGPAEVSAADQAADFYEGMGVSVTS